jgi:Ca-activated chloride channel homolog
LGNPTLDRLNAWSDEVAAGSGPERRCILVKAISKSICALFLLFCCLADPRGSPRCETRDLGGAGSQAIKSESDLVVLPVTVTDRTGNFVSGLTEGDFRVYENGRLQSISFFDHRDLPITVGLVIDSSGSMLPNRAEVASAAKDFLISSNPQDQIFVVNFNGKVTLGLSASVPFTSDVTQLEAAVLRGPSAGLTALYDATALALQHLSLGTNDKKALVVISDGGDDASHETFRQALASARHSNAIIYAVGIIADNQSDVNPGVLRKLARDTGGKAYFPKSAEDLPAICQQIARDLREQYTMAYIPADKMHDGTYRKIRVSVRAPGKGALIVRTRPGYFAPSGPAGAAATQPQG